MLLIVGLDRCRKPLVICRMALYTKVAVYITVRTCTHVYRKKTAPPPRIIYFTVTLATTPSQRGFWSLGGSCVATFTSHKLKEEMEATATATATLAPVAVTAAVATAATAAACVC